MTLGQLAVPRLAYPVSMPVCENPRNRHLGLNIKETVSVCLKQSPVID
jgi:hypothetical protein